jgi:uncharacterized protein YycO
VIARVRRAPRCTALILCLASAAACRAANEYQPRDGDIVFHTSRSSQSFAIQKATGSRYSHMGIVYVRDGAAFVFEADATVRSTPLSEWIARGVDSHFVVKRLVAAPELLTAEVLQRMTNVGQSLAGKPYDLYFEWSDDRIYCSELVWKVYRRATGLEIGPLKTIESFDLTDPVVQAKIVERFAGPPPAGEPVISPADMFASDLLVTVYSSP